MAFLNDYITNKLYIYIKKGRVFIFNKISVISCAFKVLSNTSYLEHYVS